MKVIIYSASDLIRSRIIKMLAHIKKIKAISITSKFEYNAFDLSGGVPDAIILDLDQINKEVSDLITQIKKNNASASLIFLTDLTSPAIKEACLKLGSNYCLDKATDLDQLENIISRELMAS